MYGKAVKQRDTKIQTLNVSIILYNTALAKCGPNTNLYSLKKCKKQNKPSILPLGKKLDKKISTCLEN